jgi:hypothetical protein
MKTSDEWRQSASDTASSRLASRHLAVGLRPLLFPLALSYIVLVNGNYLSSRLNIDQHSFLFWLWPFNNIYLEQFKDAPYGSHDIAWFFTVVSLCNAVWIASLCWKVIFEFRRKDFEFLRYNSLIKTSVVRFLIVGFVASALFIVVNLFGFDAEETSLFALTFKQSILVGAVKVILVYMFFLYFGFAVIVEFGGIWLRCLFSDGEPRHDG